jgi:hypothetical protein
MERLLGMSLAVPRYHLWLLNLMLSLFEARAAFEARAVGAGEVAKTCFIGQGTIKKDRCLNS